jgi:hypothetical protein
MARQEDLIDAKDSIRFVLSLKKKIELKHKFMLL